MNTPFKGGNTITQEFGQRPDYYRQFGLAGHEGIDLVPRDGDRTIYCIEDGVVVRDIDDPRSGAYGIYTVIWNKENQRSWWYCHEALNNVSVGQTFKRGDKIAVMGGTGNVQGDHLHLGLRRSDAQGNAINLNNGYSGFTNPMPVMNSLNNAQPTPDTNSLLVPKADFERMVNKSDKWDKTVAYLEIGTNPTNTSYEDAQRVIAGYKSRSTDLQNQLTTSQTEVRNREEQVGRLKTQLTEEQGMRMEVSKKLNEATKKYTEIQTVYEGRLSSLQSQVDAMGKEKGELYNRIAELEVKLKEAQSNHPTPAACEQLLKFILNLWHPKKT